MVTLAAPLSNPIRLTRLQLRQHHRSGFTPGTQRLNLIETVINFTDLINKDRWGVNVSKIEVMDENPSVCGQFLHKWEHIFPLNWIWRNLRFSFYMKIFWWRAVVFSSWVWLSKNAQLPFPHRRIFHNLARAPANFPAVLSIFQQEYGCILLSSLNIHSSSQMFRQSCSCKTSPLKSDHMSSC